MEKEVFVKIIPNFLENKNLELKKRPAIKWVDKFPKNTPILLLHGSADKRVKSDQSQKLALELEKAEIPYRLIIYNDGDHTNRNHSAEVNKEIISWLDKHLK